MIHLHHDGQDIICPCGNTPRSDGFFPCDAEGNEIEPTINSGWDGLYACPVCQRLHRLTSTDMTEQLSVKHATIYYDPTLHAIDGLGWCIELEPSSTTSRFSTLADATKYLGQHEDYFTYSDNYYKEKAL